MGYQPGQVLIQNLSTSAQYVGGTTINPGASAAVALQNVLTQTNLTQLFNEGALAIVEAPNYVWGATPDAPYPTQFAWYGPAQLPANPTVVSTTPYLGLLRNGRLFCNPGSGITVTVSLATSPDGGTTWYPLADWATDGAWTLTGAAQIPLPASLPLTQATISYTGATAPTVSLTILGS